jgi:hypothetical protein
LNVNVNKEPQFSSYQNSDYKIRIACPTSWIKQVSSNTSTFSLICRPPETNLTTIGLVAKANTAYIPSSKQKQYLSSVISSLRNDTKLQIINSSYTTISNNSAVQVFLKSSNGNQVQRLDMVTNIGYNYTIYYEADPEHFDKYLPMAQRVMNSFQFTGPKLPDLPQLPELPPLLP